MINRPEIKQGYVAARNTVTGEQAIIYEEDLNNGRFVTEEKYRELNYSSQTNRRP